MRFDTVAESFLNSVELHPEFDAVHVIDDTGQCNHLTNHDLFKLACRAGTGYKRMGLKPGDRVILALTASVGFYAAYLGAWFSGTIPIITLPSSQGRNGEKLFNLLHSVIDKSGAKLIVTNSTFGLSENNGLAACTPNELLDSREIDPRKIKPEDIAHLQCTSGSTGSPKLVVVRHRNIAANILGIGMMIDHKPMDKLVSWLPLSHDMGIIGFSYCLGWQCPLITSSTNRFIRNPMSWFQLISDYRGTLSPAPNSAFLASIRLESLRPASGIDLSCWRVALCGSEPINASTIIQFERSFKKYGYKPETFLPVYGLAENTLAVTISDVKSRPHIEDIDMETMLNQVGVSQSYEIGSKSDQSLVGLGKALPNHSIRITNKDGLPLPENTLGEVEVYGPSVTDGYWEDADATREIFRKDGFLRTGDLGFLLDNQLYIAGRKKDVIIIGGRNFSPVFIEQLIIRHIPILNAKNVVAVGILNHKTGTEILNILVGSNDVDSDTERIDIEIGIKKLLNIECNIANAVIHWVNKDLIPFTTSGKVQRYLCKEIIIRRING